MGNLDSEFEENNNVHGDSSAYIFRSIRERLIAAEESYVGRGWWCGTGKFNENQEEREKQIRDLIRRSKKNGFALDPDLQDTLDKMKRNTGEK